ncbi:MAG: ribosome maturation factor RimM [Actinomycetota bacterium]|nr:ribosome maturation factor RimM [Actinomycetota bacterium]
MLAGAIGKPHGLGGEVYVIPISDDPGRFQPGACLVHADGRVLTVETNRGHAHRLLVKFEGVDSRADAERCRGTLYIGSDDLRQLDEDEYWPHELAGCSVVDPTGASVGTVVGVVPGAAQDLLAIEAPGGERLVPIVKNIVVGVDLGDRRVTIDPPEGLLDP